ncbi:MAG: 1-acyl-sn-glycerol-3-phosphate acyltransferase [Cyanobacteria bacterium]|nr:1-acyl-sn-glycerol-3-phosphate acyltransferase [Cyanobacteriota bacterium]
MSKFLSILWAAYFFGTSFFFVVIATIVCLLTAPFDKNRRLLHLFASFWGTFYFYTNPAWRCRFEGREYIEWDKTYVLVVNHQSYWDILVLYGLYRPYKFVSKESIFKMPFIGFNMVLNQYVKIKRGDMKSIKEMMATCKAWLNQGASILLFPEGTRSEDGELQNFRDGAFRLAIDCDVPVVPIVIDGTYKVLNKSSSSINFKSDILVRVLPPINPDQFDRSSGKMRNYVHQLMKDTLDEMRGRRGIIADRKSIESTSSDTTESMIEANQGS